MMAWPAGRKFNSIQFNFTVTKKGCGQQKKKKKKKKKIETNKLNNEKKKKKKTFKKSNLDLSAR